MVSQVPQLTWKSPPLASGLGNPTRIWLRLKFRRWLSDSGSPLRVGLIYVQRAVSGRPPRQKVLLEREVIAVFFHSWIWCLQMLDIRSGMFLGAKMKIFSSEMPPLPRTFSKKENMQFLNDHQAGGFHVNKWTKFRDVEVIAGSGKPILFDVNFLRSKLEKEQLVLCGSRQKQAFF